MSRLQEKLSKWFQERYGMDELGESILGIATITYILWIAFQKQLLLAISLIGFTVCIYRILSRKHFERSEENQRYLRSIKLWKLKYENRKYFRIYMCKKCGRYIRVPKGKGKIQINCTVCGEKIIRRT